jgi:hypothetical protein
MNKDVANLLRGYKMMNEFTESERMAALPYLTIEDARIRYIDLCQVWEQSKKSGGDLRLLDQLKIEEVVRRRRYLDHIIIQEKKV